MTMVTVTVQRESATEVREELLVLLGVIGATAVRPIVVANDAPEATAKAEPEKPAEPVAEPAKAAKAERSRKPRTTVAAEVQTDPADVAAQDAADEERETQIAAAAKAEAKPEPKADPQPESEPQAPEADPAPKRVDCSSDGLKSLIGQYHTKFGANAALSDLPGMFVDYLGAPPDGNRWAAADLAGADGDRRQCLADNLASLIAKGARYASVQQ